MHQAYFCKNCRACNRYYFGFGNEAWAVLHEKIVHNRELTERGFKTNYGEMQQMWASSRSLPKWTIPDIRAS